MNKIKILKGRSPSIISRDLQIKSRQSNEELPKRRSNLFDNAYLNNNNKLQKSFSVKTTKTLPQSSSHNFLTDKLSVQNNVPPTENKVGNHLPHDKPNVISFKVPASSSTSIKDKTHFFPNSPNDHNSTKRNFLPMKNNSSYSLLKNADRASHKNIYTPSSAKKVITKVNILNQFMKAEPHSKKIIVDGNYVHGHSSPNQVGSLDKIKKINLERQSSLKNDQQMNNDERSTKIVNITQIKNQITSLNKNRNISPPNITYSPLPLQNNDRSMYPTNYFRNAHYRQPQSLYYQAQINPQYSLPQKTNIPGITKVNSTDTNTQTLKFRNAYSQNINQKPMHSMPFYRTLQDHPTLPRNQYNIPIISKNNSLKEKYLQSRMQQTNYEFKQSVSVPKIKSKKIIYGNNLKDISMEDSAKTLPFKSMISTTLADSEKHLLKLFSVIISQSLKIEQLKRYLGLSVNIKALFEYFADVTEKKLQMSLFGFSNLLKFFQIDLPFIQIYKLMNYLTNYSLESFSKVISISSQINISLNPSQNIFSESAYKSRVSSEKRLFLYSKDLIKIFGSNNNRISSRNASWGHHKNLDKFLNIQSSDFITARTIFLELNKKIEQMNVYVSQLKSSDIDNLIDSLLNYKRDPRERITENLLSDKELSDYNQSLVAPKSKLFRRLKNKNYDDFGSSLKSDHFFSKFDSEKVTKDTIKEFLMYYEVRFRPRDIDYIFQDFNISKDVLTSDAVKEFVFAEIWNA